MANAQAGTQKQFLAREIIIYRLCSSGAGDGLEPCGPLLEGARNLRKSALDPADQRTFARAISAGLTWLLFLIVLVAVLERAEAAGRPDRPAVQAEVRRIAASEGVDPRLAEAVAETESAYDAWAVSAKGAVGVMQLMPKTAGALGVRDPRNVQENVRAGVRYLRYLQWRYRGNLRLVLSAYNAGIGAVAKHRGEPPYGETQEYVEAVLDRYYGENRKTPKGAHTVFRLRDEPAFCGGSEMAYDSRGRLYVRARRSTLPCVGERLR